MNPEIAKLKAEVERLKKRVSELEDNPRYVPEPVFGPDPPKGELTAYEKKQFMEIAERAYARLPASMKKSFRPIKESTKS